jgi:DNA polymerase kappa
VLRKYDNRMESCGLDEANLDLTEYLTENNLDHPLGRIFTATQIRTEIFEAIRITASCGVGPNRMLAKMMSEMNKPNGQTLIPNDEVEILKFMRDLPVRKIPGVGKVNEHILAGLNIYFCKDLVEKATEVYVTFTEWAYEFLIKSALGLSRVMHEAQDTTV